MVVHEDSERKCLTSFILSISKGASINNLRLQHNMSSQSTKKMKNEEGKATATLFQDQEFNLFTA